MCSIIPCVNTDIYADGKCYYHYKYGTEKPVKSENKKPIPQVSKKEQGRKREYKKGRDKYLLEHPVCEMRLDNCKIKATQVHHKKGRVGKLLTEEAHFIAACENCHRTVEDNPGMAKKLGLSESRLSKA